LFLEYKINDINIEPLFQSVKALAKTDPEWGPAKKEHAAERRALDSSSAENFDSSIPLANMGGAARV